MARPATGSVHRLTPAGLQVERALGLGFDIAACNIYYANIRDEVAMVEGDEPGCVSVWPEWHRMIDELARLDNAEVVGETVATEEADALGLVGDERDDYIAGRVDELNEVAPSIVNQTVRNERGEVLAIVLAPNPGLEQEGTDG